MAPEIPGDYLDGMRDVVHEAGRQRFVMRSDGEEIGILEYQRGPSLVDFHHTWVRPDLRGRGLAAILVEAGMAFARSERLKVTPSCSYVGAWLRRHPGAADSP